MMQQDTRQSLSICGPTSHKSFMPAMSYTPLTVIYATTLGLCNRPTSCQRLGYTKSPTSGKKLNLKKNQNYTCATYNNRNTITMSYQTMFNSLVPGIRGSSLSNLRTHHLCWLKSMCTSCEIALGWTTQCTFDDKSTQVQVMALTPSGVLTQIYVVMRPH